MKNVIELSQVTQTYLEQLNVSWAADEVAIDALLQWLVQKHQVEKLDANQRLLLGSFYVALLKDLSNALGIEEENDSNKEASQAAKVKFGLLALAGIVFFGCQGFDGVNALLSATSLPIAVTFAMGIIFSLISILVFCTVDLLEISKNFGIQFKSAPELIDNYLKKTNYIKSISNHLRHTIYQKNTLAEIEQDHKQIQLLLILYNSDDGRAKLKESLDNPALKAAEIIAAGFTGAIYFSGGFFAGQTLALAIASLVGTTVASTFWPIIAVGVFIGLLAFSIYWFMERPRVENLVGRWFGLDKEKIDACCDPDLVKKENEELNSIERLFSDRRSELEAITEKNESGNKPIRRVNSLPRLPSSFKYSQQFFADGLAEKDSRIEPNRGLNFG